MSANQHWNEQAQVSSGIAKTKVRFDTAPHRIASALINSAASTDECRSPAASSSLRRPAQP